MAYQPHFSRLTFLFLASIVIALAWTSVRVVGGRGGSSDLSKLPSVEFSSEAPMRAPEFSVSKTKNATRASINPQNTCVPVPSGLVGWWPADGNPNDLVAANNGVLRNGVAFANGKVAQGFSLDGVDDLVEIPDSSALRPDHISIEAWVKFDNLDSANTARAGLQYIVFKRAPNLGRFEGYTLVKDRVSGVDNFDFVITPLGGSQTSVRSTTSITVGQFYHVVATYDRSTMKLYVNGVLENQTPLTLPMEYGDRSVFIGGTDESVFDGRLVGTVDETSIYNRALSSSEIHDIYVASAAGKCEVVPLLKQNEPSPSWGGDPYDHLNQNSAYKNGDTSIARWGCGITSLAMVIRSYGVTVGTDNRDVTPRNLNEWLRNETGGYTSDGRVNWAKVSKYTNSQVEFVGFFGADLSQIEANLSAGRRVIAWVDGQKHFVVVTRRSGTSLMINDPLYDRQTYASSANGTRVFRRGTGNPSKTLSFTGRSPVTLIVTDPLGRRTGLDPATNTELNEIPGASYAHDRFASGVLPGDTDPQVFIESAKVFYLLNPIDGEYRVAVIGTGAGNYAIDVNETDAQGNEISQTILGSTTVGGPITYSVNYNTQGGTLPPSPFLRTLTGRVVDGSGNGISGITINLSGTQAGTTLTDPNGHYSLGSVQQGGNYMVTPTKVGFSFNPAGQNFSNLSSSVSANFVGTPAPILFTLSETDSVAALNSVTFSRAPFRLFDAFNFSADQRTRIILFTSDLGLTQPNSSILSVQAAGITLPVENVGPLSGLPSLSGSYIVVRLPNGLPTGNLQLTISLNGVTSNSTTLSISP